TRVRSRSDTGEERTYALKVYSDDFVERVWTHSQALAEHTQPEYGGICTASHYIPQERLLIFPWVEGEFLSEIVDERKPELVTVAEQGAVGLQCPPTVPQQLH